MTKYDKNALLLVDLQQDFCEGGNLAVPKASAVIYLANQLQPYFDFVVATKDWHPQNHESFASNHQDKSIGDVINLHGVEQILWPDHCVQHSKGGEFHPGLNTILIKKILYKGTDKTIDSYSAFFDNKHLQATGLNDYLHGNSITTLYIMGLATDYCVKFTCLDAIKLGFETVLIEDACRGVELNPGDIDKSLRLMHDSGVKIVTAQDVFHGMRISA